MAQFQYLPRDKGSFILEQSGTRIAEMVVDISAGVVSVYHTGVVEEAQGQGLGTRLVKEMAAYARQNSLKVIPYCPFVKKLFKRHPEQYADVWLREK